MHDIRAYLGKQHQDATADVTPTHGTVLQLVRKVEDVGHKLYVDNYFISPDLFKDICKRKIAVKLFSLIEKECPKFWPQSPQNEERRVVSRV
jgi:hypothetical protein